MRVVVSKLVQSTSMYLICLYQFPVHGDQEQKIDYYLTVGAYNSLAAWYIILQVYTIEDFIVLLCIRFGNVSSSQPILELLLNLPIIHVMNVEAAFTVLCPVSSLSTVSAHIWEGLCLPCHIDIHGNWIAWHGGRVPRRKDASGKCQGFQVQRGRSQCDVGWFMQGLKNFIPHMILIHLDSKVKPHIRICV